MQAQPAVAGTCRRRAAGAGRRSPCRPRRPWRGGRAAPRRGSRCWRSRAARRSARCAPRPRARRPARQAGTPGSRSAAWAWTTGSSQSSGDSIPLDPLLQSPGGPAGRGWSRARDRWTSARRGRAAPRCRRPASAPWCAGCAASRGGRRPAGRCGRSSPAKSRSPENITSEMSSPSVSYGDRKVTDPRVWPGVWSTVNVRPASSRSWPSAELLDPVRLGEGVLAAEHHLGRLGAHAGHRVGEQVPVVGVDPGRRVVRAGDRRDAPHVVDVPVGDQHGHRLEPVLGDDLGHAGGGVLAGVDDHALRARPRGRDVAVGAPRTCGESGDQHARRLSRPAAGSLIRTSAGDVHAGRRKGFD